MARGIRARHRLASRQYRSTPYPFPSCHQEILEKKEPHHQKCPHQKCPKVLERKDWEDANCSVCMEYPHNAVLLLCSSHDKGCRPYMCATSCRYSNCLDQFKKAYTKTTPLTRVQTSQVSVDNSTVGSGSSLPNENCETAELACPLCRGQVKGWTVVEPAREYLNAKKRSCMQDGCSFIGTYQELRKHVRAEHPSARPREVDPLHEQKWRRLERERERDDVISTIRSSMPGAMVMGDYVIEGNPRGFEMEDFGDTDEGEEDYDVGFGFDMFLLMQMIGTAGTSLNARLRRLGRGYHRTIGENDGRMIPDGAAVSGEDDNDESWIGRRHRRRRREVGNGRSERRQMRRNQQRSVIDLT